MTAVHELDVIYEAVERSLFDAAKRMLLKASSRPGPSGERIDRAGYQLMARLEEAGDLRLTELASVSELDVSTVSRQVRALEDITMVQRRADPDDGRATRVELTAAGRRELAALRRERHERLAVAMADWTGDDRATLTTLLQRLAEDLGPACSRPLSRSMSREASTR